MFKSEKFNRSAQDFPTESGVPNIVNGSMPISQSRRRTAAFIFRGIGKLRIEFGTISSRGIRATSVAKLTIENAPRCRSARSTKAGPGTIKTGDLDFPLSI